LDALLACSSPRSSPENSRQPNVGAGLVPARAGAGRSREFIFTESHFTPLYSGEARRGFPASGTLPCPVAGARPLPLGWASTHPPHIDNHLDCLDASPEGGLPVAQGANPGWGWGGVGLASVGWRRLAWVGLSLEVDLGCRRLASHGAGWRGTPRKGKVGAPTSPGFTPWAKGRPPCGMASGTDRCPRGLGEVLVTTWPISTTSATGVYGRNASLPPPDLLLSSA
jgi:hypothetical protein